MIDKLNEIIINIIEYEIIGKNYSDLNIIQI